jgi:hypothetical protein
MDSEILRDRTMTDTLTCVNTDAPLENVENSEEAVVSQVRLSYENISRHTICIPKVSNKITRQYIFSVFCALHIGFIEKLTEVPIKNDANHKRVFIKVKWNQTELSKYICDRFDTGGNVKVVYSVPWYWICVSSIRMTSSHT